eukprot:TRINITY_DN15316_c0_g1_i1.p1 TRINITY_DN15316_c0_g1~~TRINITY_DN15316_c0_g1_i1.p1  ORF type:complete len:640 (+),score=201.17 TRINITY_DN15316_c0_g1_i1:56-1975(+)
MSDQTVKQLKKEFSDLSVSMIGDILRTCENDRDAAASMLRGMENEENNKKIKELGSMFPDLSREALTEVLNKHNWNVEESIATAFNVMENREREVETENQLKKMTHLFEQLPEEIVRKAVIDNDGDIEEATIQLTTLITLQKQKEEAANKGIQDRNLRTLKIQALVEKFPDLTREDVMKQLEINKEDIKGAHAALLKLSAERKQKILQDKFPSMSAKDISAALESTDWNVEQAQTVLSSKQQSQGTVSLKKIETIFDRADDDVRKLEKDITQSHADFFKATNDTAAATFRNNIEKILETQVRAGDAPGIAPPIREIDERLGKKPAPIDETNVVAHSEKENPAQRPAVPPTTSVIENSSKFRVNLKASPERVDIGNKIFVEWTLENGATTNYDWIGLYPTDAPNKSYISYQWRGKSETSGKIEFVAPSTYGTYEFRYFFYGSYEHTTRSNRITIGPEVKLEVKLSPGDRTIVGNFNQLSGNNYPRAWVGLYGKSEKNNRNFITYEYAPGVTGQVSMEAPVKPGEYELRYFTDSYSEISTSNAIVIEGEDKLDAKYADGVIDIDMKIVSCDARTDRAWLGVFFTTETDQKQWRRYKYLNVNEGNLKLKAPRTPGTYEVRLFSRGTYQPVFKSNSFIIPLSS